MDHKFDDKLDEMLKLDRENLEKIKQLTQQNAEQKKIEAVFAVMKQNYDRLAEALQKKKVEEPQKWTEVENKWKAERNALIRQIFNREDKQKVEAKLEAMIDALKREEHTKDEDNKQSEIANKEILDRLMSNMGVMDSATGIAHELNLAVTFNSVGNAETFLKDLISKLNERGIRYYEPGLTRKGNDVFISSEDNLHAVEELNRQMQHTPTA